MQRDATEFYRIYSNPKGVDSLSPVKLTVIRLYSLVKCPVNNWNSVFSPCMLNKLNPSVCLSFCLSSYPESFPRPPPACLPACCLPACLPARPCQSVCLSVCQYRYIFKHERYYVCLSVFLRPPTSPTSCLFPCLGIADC